MGPRAGALLTVVLLAALPAAAQPAPCTDSPRVCGKRAFDAGVDAFGKADYKAALEHFRVAHSIQDHPIVAFNLALAEAKNDLVLEALARLDALIASPNADAELVANAKEERASIERAVATVKVDVVGGSNVSLEIAGRKASGNPASLQVNPGKQHVVVVVDGKVAIDRDVDVRSGERLTLNVDRERVLDLGAGNPPPGNAGSAPPKVDRPPVEDTGGLGPGWFWVGAGVTAVLGGVTIWSGLDVQKAKDEYESETDPERKQQLLDDGHAKETRTNVLIAGTALAAVGTAALGIFAVDWNGGSASLELGPRSAGLGVRGSF